MSPFDGDMSYIYPAMIGPNLRVTRHDICRSVAERYGLTVSDLRSPERGRHVAWPRQEAMALMYATGRWNRGEIGHAVNRTTWTVTHGVAAHLARQASMGGASL